MAGFGTILPAGVYVRNNVHDGDIKYGPWNSLEEFKTYVPTEYRKPGLRFALFGVGEIVDYQYVGGVEDHHIVERFRSATAYVSFWITPAADEKVTDLPLSPTDGYRVLHNNIIKEYQTDTWVDLYGGTGIALQNGMAVVVNNDGLTVNQVYVYNSTLAIWENKTAGIVIPPDKFFTAFVDNKRVVRDVRTEISNVRNIISSGPYYINKNIANLPNSKSGSGMIMCLVHNEQNLIYIYYDNSVEWIQRKINGVYGEWELMHGSKQTGLLAPTAERIDTWIKLPEHERYHKHIDANGTWWYQPETFLIDFTKDEEPVPLAASIASFETVSAYGVS
jgi:hypothetical protein